MNLPQTYAGNLTRRIMLAITKRISSDINVQDFRAIHEAVLSTLEKEFPSKIQEEISPSTSTSTPGESFLDSKIHKQFTNEEIAHLQAIWKSRQN